MTELKNSFLAVFVAVLLSAGVFAADGGGGVPGSNTNAVMGLFNGKKIEISRDGGDLTAVLGGAGRRKPVIEDRHLPSDFFLSLNGEQLTWGQVDGYIDLLLLQNPLGIPPIASADEVAQIIANTRRQYAIKVGNVYVRNALLAQEARKVGLSISSAEMAVALTNSVRRVKPDLREKVLAAITKPDSFFYRDQRNYQLTMKYRNQVLMKGLEATEDEKAAVVKMREDLIAASMLTNRLLRPRMEGWLKEIRAGTRSFEKTAEEFSDCSSAENEGVFGEFDRESDLQSALKAFAFSATTNTLSEVIETPYSYHIVKVLKRTYDEDEDVKNGPSSVKIAHIMLEKVEVPQPLDDAGARELVVKRKVGSLLVVKQRELLESADLKSVVPIRLLKGKKERK